MNHPERWRAVAGYEGLYEVSDEGRVRNIARRSNVKPGRLIKPKFSGKYYQVQLYKNGAKRFFGLHCVVAAAFVGQCPEGQEVNHIDGDKSNNRADNLEYMTPKKNHEHAAALGLKCRGERHPEAKLTAEQVREIRDLEGKMMKTEIAARFGVTPPLITAIHKRRVWKHV